MSIEGRVIVGPPDRERTAVVTIAIPADAEVPIDRTWRFIGWLDDMTITVHATPARVHIYEPDPDEASG